MPVKRSRPEFPELSRLTRENDESRRYNSLRSRSPSLSKPPPIHVLSRLMGHSSTEITEIYLQVVGDEQRNLVMEVGWLKTRKIRKRLICSTV